jgi:hypothetical protein
MLASLARTALQASSLADLIRLAKRPLSALSRHPRAKQSLGIGPAPYGIEAQQVVFPPAGEATARGCSGAKAATR